MRAQEVADRLTAAFTPPSSRAVDIFAMAQARAVPVGPGEHPRRSHWRMILCASSPISTVSASRDVSERGACSRASVQQALAEGEAVGMEDTFSEHVSLQALVAEAQRLLEDSLAVNAALQEALVEHDWCGVDLVVHCVSGHGGFDQHPLYGG